MFKTQRLLSSLRYAFLGNLLFWLSSCFYVPKANGPLKTAHHYWKPGERQERLLVYLPGRGDHAEDFERRGLWEALRERDLPFDAVAAEAHLGYYFKMNLVDRLREDVLKPAREQGYQEIWVVGNSLGGLGALLTEKLHPGTWSGMFLIAPFLGDDRNLYREFEDAGGVRHWQPRGEFAKTDFSPRLWQWLKDWPEERQSRPPTYLGYGDGDRLRLGIDHLAPLLPEERVIEEPGGHQWSTWLPLWQAMLEEAREDLAMHPR